MKLCFITNSGAQWVSNLGDFTLVLGHLCLPEYNSKWRDYRDFCKGLVKKQYVVLDNSAYELKKPLENRVLLDLVEEIEFQEVVAPDYFGDADRTIDAVYDFLEDSSRSSANFAIQAVVQGDTVENWKRCFVALRETSVDVIGLSTTAEKITARLDLIDWISRSFPAEALKDKEFHALGLSDPRELVSIVSRYPFVTRNDSSTAVAQAMSGYRLELDGSLPHGKIYMDFEKAWDSKYDVDTLWNISILRKITREDANEDRDSGL